METYNLRFKTRSRKTATRHVAISAIVGATIMTAAHGQEHKPPFYRDKACLLVLIDADGTERPIATPAEWASRGKHILANMQLVMGPLPDRSGKPPLDVKELEVVRLDKAVRKKITYVAEKGDRRDEDEP